MTLAYSTWVSVMLWSGLSSSCWARIKRLFSGVRSSCDMLAMNSDLYFDETASWPAFSSTRRLDSSTSWFFCSASMFCSASSLAWRSQVLVGLAQLFLLRAELFGQRLGLLEQRLGERAAFDRAEDEADALGDRVEERLMGDAERREGRELDDGAHRSLEQDRQDDDVEREATRRAPS